MASIVHQAIENYNDLLSSENDTLVNEWPLMQSPIPVVLIVILYLYFVLNVGPKWMEKRPAFKLKSVLIFYNLYQVLFSVWLCAHAFKVKNLGPYIFSHMCTRSQNPELEKLIVKSAWWYFFSKITELLDTIFFVLRKKQSQVSFLHVYHHSVMVIGTWAYLKFLPGEQGLLIGFLNSLVHVVMYFYYFLAALGPQYQKYLWWKKYMTWMQLTQFGIMLVYLAFGVAVNCEMPRAWTYFFTTNVVTFMFLFWNYYRKAYKGNVTGKLSQKTVSNINGVKSSIEELSSNGVQKNQCSEELPSTDVNKRIFSDKKKG
ncbi:elongation of very long chain fatty acids protein-like [Sitophilus oryzae]|uniref:Elongation of very long chain fatty acids protein n=1 Tax=Sitophilus oryzae TaxID=7048 RepID=A0A6J2XVD1_SITOR|nr:elongation of very long chain fatty acids protein-like [Sitophilus oryzae]